MLEDSKNSSSKRRAAVNPEEVMDTKKLALNSLYDFPGAYQCSLCNLTFNTAEILQRHEKKYHKCLRISESPPKKIHPPVAQKTNKLLISTAAGVRVKEIQYKCASCRRTFSTKALLEKHIDLVHKRRGFRCKNCMSTLPTLKELYFHKRIYHTKNYVTSSCKKDLKNSQIEEKSGSDNNALVDFKSLDSDSNVSLTCNSCFYRCSDQTTFLKHVEDTHKVKCAKETEGSNLSHDNSKSIVTNPRQPKKQEYSPSLITSANEFTCHVCNKSFRKKTSLKSHQIYCRRKLRIESPHLKKSTNIGTARSQ
ncbi:hypothetical protein SK128_020466 [Halocaridina rubra]|uniref:C2H2-type domain-containing protein n=1 Tax=Halocaridina rubra TaxID=373956 RepID=A0AAN8XAB2_HALRR